MIYYDNESTLNFERLEINVGPSSYKNDNIDEVSLSDTTSLSNSSDEEDSEQVVSNHETSIDSEACYVKRKKLISFHEPLVTSIKFVERTSLRDKCVLYYTDEDMHR